MKLNFFIYTCRQCFDGPYQLLLQTRLGEIFQYRLQFPMAEEMGNQHIASRSIGSDLKLPVLRPEHPENQAAFILRLRDAKRHVKRPFRRMLFQYLQLFFNQDGKLLIQRLLLLPVFSGFRLGCLRRPRLYAFLCFPRFQAGPPDAVVLPFFLKKAIQNTHTIPPFRPVASRGSRAAQNSAWNAEEMKVLVSGSALDLLSALRVPSAD